MRSFIAPPIGYAPLRSVAIAVALALAVLCTDANAASKPPAFAAGAHAIDITPPSFPVSMNGGMADRLASRAHDRLHARCLVLHDGTSSTKLALVVVDSCLTPRSVFDAAKEMANRATGIPTSHMTMSATHTHTAPPVANAFQSRADPRYAAYLAKKIAEGVKLAHDNLEPAEIGWAVGRDPTQVFNRRWRVRDGQQYENPFGVTTDKARMNPGYNNPLVSEPVGPVDPLIHMIAVRSRSDRRPIALYANYSLHYVGGVPGGMLSADYYGQFARDMTKLLKLEATPQGRQPFMAAMSNGASGDINNVNFSLKTRPRRKPFEQIMAVSKSVSQNTLKAYNGIKWQSWAKLASAERDVPIGVRKPGTNEINEARKVLAAAAAENRKLRGLKEVYAGETVDLSHYPDKVLVKAQVVRIGEVAICALPTECLVEVGLRLREASPFKHTFVVELANGYNGYLPTVEQHRLGGYETWRAKSSYLEIEAAPKLHRVLTTLLAEVNR